MSKELNHNERLIKEMHELKNRFNALDPYTKKDCFHVHGFITDCINHAEQTGRMCRDSIWNATAMFILKDEETTIKKGMSLKEYFDKFGDGLENAVGIREIGLYTSKGEYIKI